MKYEKMAAAAVAAGLAESLAADCNKSATAARRGLIISALSVAGGCRPAWIASEDRGRGMLAYNLGSLCVVALAGCVALAAWLAGAVAVCLWSCVVGAVVSAALVVVCWAWLRGWL